MGYEDFADIQSTEFMVGPKIIAFGGATWQISNIAATQIKREVLGINEPEPRFVDFVPPLNLNKLGMFFLAFSISIFGGLVFREGWVPMVLFFGVIAGFYFNAVQKKNKKIDELKIIKNEIKRKQKIWNSIKQNPPVVYTLMLETNAGSKPLFHSFDRQQIQCVNDAITRAMDSNEAAVVHLNVDAINVGAMDSINNFGSAIYRQHVENK